MSVDLSITDLDILFNLIFNKYGDVNICYLASLVCLDTTILCGTPLTVYLSYDTKLISIHLVAFICKIEIS